MDLREIGWGGVDWIDRAQDRDQWRAVVNTVTNLRVLSRLSRPDPLLFPSSSSSIVLTRLSGSRSRPSTSHNIWWRRKSNPDLWICSQELWTLDHRGGAVYCVIIQMTYI
jgi:hypothetical protein